jgi:hypothetical protein
MSETGAQSAPEPDVSPAGGAVYFPVSLTKLVVMSLFTFGLYQPYWLFCQWCYVRDNENSEISVILRLFFPGIFCYPLFRRIRATADAEKISPSFAAGPLAGAWVLLALLTNLPGPLVLLFPLVAFTLLPVQKTVNAINAAADPEHDRNATFTLWNKIAIVFGGLSWLGVIVTVLQSPESFIPH